MRIDLKQYSLLANSIIGAGSVLQAQVNYIDIEPDIEIDTFTEIFFLDVDDNGTDDFFGMGVLYNTIGSGTFVEKVYGPKYILFR